MAKKKTLTVLGRVPTEEEVDNGEAEWCWTCSNAKCKLNREDKLTMCKHFIKRSREDMEKDPHFGGHA